MKLSKFCMSVLVLSSLTAVIAPTDVHAIHFRNCDEAWAKGYGNIYVGQDGYSRSLDADKDGIACEISKSKGKFRARRADGKPLNAVQSSAVPVLKNGWVKENSLWYYYRNNQRVTNEWVGDYYLTSSGEMATSKWISYGNYWYYVDAAGKYLRNTWSGGYYLQSDGSMASAKWAKDGNTWYYFNESGKYLRNTWKGKYYLLSDGSMASNKWIQDPNYGNSWFYLSADGSYVTGRQTIGNSTYLFDGSGAMITGWHKDNQNWYYFGASGALASGWKQIDGKWYYLNESGVMLANKWVGDYYLGSSGAMLVNTVTPDGYVVDANGKWVRDVKTESSELSNSSSDQSSQSADETSSESSIDSLDNETVEKAVGRVRYYAYEMHLSRQDTYDQLTTEYIDGFSSKVAEAALAKVKVDWQANAKVIVDQGLTYSKSKSQIVEDLVGRKFTQQEIVIATQGIDWNNVALKAASDLTFLAKSRQDLYDWLILKGFTPEEAAYATKNTPDSAWQH